MKPITYEIVVYDDGTSAINLFDRDGETGQLSYRGRDFRDVDATSNILSAIQDPSAITDLRQELAEVIGNYEMMRHSWAVLYELLLTEHSAEWIAKMTPDEKGNDK